MSCVEAPMRFIEGYEVWWIIALGLLSDYFFG
jgi:hypothetical protein